MIKQIIIDLSDNQINNSNYILVTTDGQQGYKVSINL